MYDIFLVPHFEKAGWSSGGHKRGGKQLDFPRPFVRALLLSLTRVWGKADIPMYLFGKASVNDKQFDSEASLVFKIHSVVYVVFILF